MASEKENKVITINGDAVAPGENRQVKINIARLPTGTLIDIPIHVFNAKKPGPSILVQAGLHGDEINGVETLRRMLQNDLFKIKRGAVIVVPILNIFGFIHFSRDVPDGKDVNRSFPGTRRGSLASRIAYNYTSEILPQIDFGIDLHTGGSQRHNFPQIRYTAADERSKILAEAFNAPFCFASRLIGGSFRKTTFKLGIPTIVYEAGESMRFNEEAIVKGIQGISNVLVVHKMLSKENGFRKEKSIHFESTRWIRASRAGMFIPSAVNGKRVSKGEELGVITDTYAKKSKSIKAPYEGYIFSINNQAVVNQGDALFRIGK
ncbi:succinylglutamate desuccinylase/aspartoacylase family protein [Flagellimonas allohymeniacidonis]|uniref:Succinylglutamate desuccinylase/aspartoacylase family protein n=1 Tax=Flagellimonas allohymeniacidonis TaxID=2517819 RepID=A0A4Q8QB23_9FLAO|nr:succinylglutamate desuccinylase/aspartoacylase family protein [Allomuricauda hymeniacidonis]TAI47471.1 succinylglutamate desuccinylase/aspartoacylase family protein [Allomuricauda hymeniacidonis]